MDDNVIHLAFQSTELTLENITFSTCKNCKNKTFTVIYDGQDFPRLTCAACGQHIGCIGWVGEYK